MARRRGRGRGRGGITVQVRGAQRLAALLEQLPEELQTALRRAVRESAEAIRDDVRENVRKDSGNLQESVDIEYRDQGLAARVGWRDRDDYYAHFHEFGTSSIPANPALQSAIERERGKIAGRIRDEVRRVLP